jgi:hypothetical protein
VGGGEVGSDIQTLFYSKLVLNLANTNLNCNHIKHKWIISNRDTRLVEQVCKQQSGHKMYKKRMALNLNTKSVKITKEVLWKCIFTCLLTTQQRSREDSRINKFLKTGYSSISLRKLREKRNIKLYISSQLKGFGGIRRNKIIPNEASIIYEHLVDTNWKLLEKIKDLVQKKGNKDFERKVCNEIAENKMFNGLGPKQSRNLLQMLGVTIYEIPIDSRITDWLNINNIFPFKLNSKGLSDIEFYCFINDAIIELCKKSKTKPCLFDAAVFSLKE